MVRLATQVLLLVIMSAAVLTTPVPKPTYPEGYPTRSEAGRMATPTPSSKHGGDYSYDARILVNSTYYSFHHSPFSFYFASTTSPVMVGEREVGESELMSCDMLPWQVRLLIYQPPSPGLRLGCRGTILDSLHVLTAASCFPKSGRVRVIAGNSRVYHVVSASIEKDVTLYLGYDPKTRRNDIALIKLPRHIKLNMPCVKPVCLRPLFVADSDKCFTSGWGPVDESSAATAKSEVTAPDHVDHCDGVFYTPKEQMQLCAKYLT